MIVRSTARVGASCVEHHWSAVILLATIASIAVALAGCSSASDERPDQVDIETTRGPVTARLRLDSDTVVVGAPIMLQLDVLAEQGVTVHLPELGLESAPLNFLEPDIRADLPDGDRRRWTLRCEVDCFEPGEHELPAITVDFTDQRDRDEEPIEGFIELDPVPIMVKTALDADEEDPTLRDIRGTVALPVGGIPTWVVLAAGLVILGIVGGIILILWRREGAGPPPTPADVQALGELDRLAADRLLESRRFQDYYVRLSDIVRWYIERRFDLRAPERTTEEFLREMERSRLLTTPQKQTLAGFLRSADLVKFARHEPPVDEGHRSLELARAFVIETPVPPSAVDSVPPAAGALNEVRT